MRVIFKYLKPIIFLGLGSFLLWIACKDINLSEFKNTLRTIPLHWVFLSMLLGYLAFVFRGLRWKLLIKPLGFEPRSIDLVHAIAFGYLFNSFIPRSGELVRCTALNRVTNIPVSKLFGHVLLERLIDFILLAICLSLSIIFNYNDFMKFAQLNLAYEYISIYRNCDILYLGPF